MYTTLGPEEKKTLSISDEHKIGMQNCPMNRTVRGNDWILKM